MILVGLPGSGKSVLAARLATSVRAAVICSADTWFMSATGYHFDRDQLGQAHKACRQAFLAAVTARSPVIVIDNTNLTAHERAPYLALALQHGYRVRIRVLPATPETAATRNIHQVPRSVIDDMQRQLDLAPGDYLVDPPAGVDPATGTRHPLGF